ncbi:hypothetical protein WH47_12554 [Habropoda laboriosa]|uniref:Uncharacterized protein n=1 Tax=Habropoda laboriosa TaxID=597456 RepID=A0A0L7R094_9HYME|nr:hypothetical protein WH47_12554 [Habropoda laboriosa]
MRTHFNASHKPNNSFVQVETNDRSCHVRESNCPGISRNREEEEEEEERSKVGHEAGAVSLAEQRPRHTGIETVSARLYPTPEGKVIGPPPRDFIWIDFILRQTAFSQRRHRRRFEFRRHFGTVYGLACASWRVTNTRPGYPSVRPSDILWPFDGSRFLASGQSAVLACTGESTFLWFPVDAVAVDVGVFARFDWQRNERAHPLKTLSGVAGFFHRLSRGCGWLMSRFLKLDRGIGTCLGTLSPYQGGYTICIRRRKYSTSIVLQREPRWTIPTTVEQRRMRSAAPQQPYSNRLAFESSFGPNQHWDGAQEFEKMSDLSRTGKETKQVDLCKTLLRLPCALEDGRRPFVD